MKNARRIIWLYRGKTTGRYFGNLAANTQLDSYPQNISRLRLLPSLASGDLASFRSLDLDRELAIYLTRKRRSNWFARHPMTRAVFIGIARLRAAWAFLTFLRYFRETQPRAVGIWNGMKFPETLIVRAAQACGVPVLRFELGMLPYTRVIDGKGINFENSVPRNPAFYRALPPPPETLPPSLVRRPRNPAKGCDATSNEIPLPKSYLFVPFQVAMDTQILAFSPWIPSMRALFSLMVEVRDELARKHPERADVHVVFKEHPTCPEHYEDLHALAKAHGRVLFANDNSTQQLIEGAEAVLTINSTVGIEGLLYRKKVIVLGQAFYDLEGMTLHAGSRVELFDAVERVFTWQPDHDLAGRFLNYLATEYCVPRKEGKPEEFLSGDLDNWAANEKRIRSILAEAERAGLPS